MDEPEENRQEITPACPQDETFWVVAGIVMPYHTKKKNYLSTFAISNNGFLASMSSTNQTSQPSVFDDFTNLYSLTKTLRFELKPSEEMENYLNFEKDQQRAIYYKEIKILFDQLHRNFIAQSLEYYTKQGVDYTEVWNKYKIFIEAKKNRKKDDPKSKTAFDTAKKEFEKIKEFYRKKIVEIFNLHADNWKLEVNRDLAEKYPEKYIKIDKKTGEEELLNCLKDKGIKVLTEAGILEVLKLYLEKDLFVDRDGKPFSQERKNKLLEGVEFFDKFFTYFGPFNETRENFYKFDGTATAIPTRIIDDNLIRFFDNIILVNSGLKIGEASFKPIEASFDFNKNIFELSSFNNFVTQKGIDLYNGGQNGDVNLGSFKTKLSSHIQNKFSKSKRLTLKNLYKLMLSEKTTLFEEETAESCIHILQEVRDKNQGNLPKVREVFDYIFSNKNSLEVLQKIYLKKDSINDLSVDFFGGNNWFLLEETIKDLGYGKNEKGRVRLDDFINLSALREALDALSSGKYEFLNSKKKNSKNQKIEESLFETKQKGYKTEEIFKPDLLREEQKQSHDLWGIFIDLWQKKVEAQIKENQKFVEVCEVELLNKGKYEPLKKTNYEHTFEYKEKQETKAQTQANLAKLFLDSCMKIWHEVKIFELVKNVNRKPVSFYDDYKDDLNEEFYEKVKTYFEDFVLSKFYDKIRNFSTKKPFSTSKFKINFENSTLLAGWDLNKESDNTSIILKSPIGYELIIMNKSYNKVFDKEKNPELYNVQNSDFQKMEYKLLPGPNKMLPKVAFASSNRELLKDVFAKYPNIETIREQETFKKEKLVKEDLNTWIAFYQEVLKAYSDWKIFDWKFKNPKDYEDVSEFYRNVQIQGYKLSFVPVNNNILKNLEKEGKVYRFQIKNKDWNQFSKGKKNLQTIYWEFLFDRRNLEKNTIKLNGEAEIFQRPKSNNLQKKQKIDSSGKSIFKGKTEKPVLENERYFDNHLFFHCPITINFSAKEISRYNEFIKLVDDLDTQNLNYLGIDRGENHLLYYSLVNSKGEILEQESLNELGAIDPKTGRSKDYERLLNARQESKKDAQDKWSVIGNIKELKSGYLSLAVHEICKLAFDNNALIVLENLNYGFKKSRTIKFEKSVYQKFEVALATKLQHLFFKSKDPFELGGVLNAVQLVPKLEKVSDLDSKDQWGVIRYVPASYTSKICPLTGWHKTIYLKDNVADIKKAFNPDGDNPILIGWDNQEKCYTFSYQTDIKLQGSEHFKEGYCTLYLLPKIIRTAYRDRSLQTTKSEELSNGLSDLLNPFLQSTDKNNINRTIFENFDDKHWKKLKHFFDQLCNIRVKVEQDGKKLDIIQSPVPFISGGEKIFFDSQEKNREAIEQKLDRVLPQNGDANGAYHIALLGLTTNDQETST